MAAGTPVVCSDIPVFREVAGSAARFVPPDDADGWAREVGRVLGDEPLMRELGLSRAASFSWQRTGDQTLAVWTEGRRAITPAAAHRRVTAFESTLASNNLAGEP